MFNLKKNQESKKQDDSGKEQIEKLDLDKLEKVSGGAGLRDVGKVDPTDVDDNTRSKS